jgi:hypothetical protein
MEGSYDDLNVLAKVISLLAAVNFHHVAVMAPSEISIAINNNNNSSLLVQVRDRWRALVSTVKNLRVP